MLLAAERSILEEAIRRFPAFDKLYLMRGQLEERAGNREAAKAAYNAGLKRCIHSAPLWISLAKLEETSKNFSRARVVLEQARLKNPGNDFIWLAAVRTELRSERKKEAESLLAKGLQVCVLHSPEKDIIWEASPSWVFCEIQGPVCLSLRSYELLKDYVYICQSLPSRNEAGKFSSEELDYLTSLCKTLGSMQ